MDPMQMLVAFFGLVLSVVSWVVARQRGRRGFFYFLLCYLILVPLAVILLLLVTIMGYDVGTAPFTFSFLLAPFLVLSFILLLPNKKKRADRIALERDTKKCPFCAELIKYEAVVCKHCGRELSSLAPVATTAVTKPSHGENMTTTAHSSSHTSSGSITLCSWCSRPNESNARYCIACGKPFGIPAHTKTDADSPSEPSRPAVEPLQPTLEDSKPSVFPHGSILESPTSGSENERLPSSGTIIRHPSSIPISPAAPATPPLQVEADSLRAQSDDTKGAVHFTLGERNGRACSRIAALITLGVAGIGVLATIGILYLRSDKAESYPQKEERGAKELDTRSNRQPSTDREMAMELAMAAWKNTEWGRRNVSSGLKESTVWKTKITGQGDGLWTVGLPLERPTEFASSFYDSARERSALPTREDFFVTVELEKQGAEWSQLSVKIQEMTGGYLQRVLEEVKNEIAPSQKEDPRLNGVDSKAEESRRENAKVNAEPMRQALAGSEKAREAGGEKPQPEPVQTDTRRQDGDGSGTGAAVTSAASETPAQLSNPIPPYKTYWTSTASGRTRVLHSEGDRIVMEEADRNDPPGGMSVLRSVGGGTYFGNRTAKMRVEAPGVQDLLIGTYETSIEFSLITGDRIEGRVFDYQGGCEWRVETDYRTGRVVSCTVAPGQKMVWYPFVLIRQK